GHTWSGTAHNSTSSRAGARAQWASIGGSLPTTGWSLMFWIYSDAAYGLVDNQYVLELSGDGNNRIRIYQHTINPGVLRLAYSADSNTQFSTFAGINTMLPGQWHHVVLSYDGANLQSYLDGVLVQTLARSPFVVPASQLSIGALVDSDTNHTPTVLIDDLVILERAIPADEGRAVYESDAPTFAESSTFQFRVGNGLVWGDNEGLFARDEDGTAVLAVVGVDSKSWGGITLDKGDVMIGNSTSGYLQFDRSAQSVSLVNANLALFDGATKFVETDPVNGIGIQTYTLQDINVNFTRAISWWSNLDSKSGLPDVRLYGLRFNNDVTAGLQAFGDNVSGRQATILMYATTRDASKTAGLSLNVTHSGSSVASISADQVSLSAGSSALSVAAAGIFGTHITQTSTTAARPALSLSQADLSEEFIRFNGTISAGNPINTTALGSYYGRVRVSVNGTFRWLALYN
ncbi:MAG: hypothetical protein KJZ93_31815, partial [Caldilineaceae bacterium]|nr:hypothetical protein [Caldilineaceae bacterium]